jgi:hypothetical protein
MATTKRTFENLVIEVHRNYNAAVARNGTPYKRDSPEAGGLSQRSTREIGAGSALRASD